MTRKKQPPPASDEQPEHLTPLQYRFVEALLTGKSIKDAAEIAGCSRRAACYWMRPGDSPVRMAYEARRAAVVAQFDGRIAKLHELTLSALEDLLGKKTPPFIRVQAAKMLYEAHLQEHGERKEPRSTLDLLKTEGMVYYDEKMQWGSVNVAMYTDKGKERLEEHEDYE